MSTTAEKKSGTTRSRVSLREKTQSLESGSAKQNWRVLANLLDIQHRLPENLKEFLERNTSMKVM